MKKVIIVEDQTILRELIEGVIDTMAMVEVIGSTGDGAQGVDLCLDSNPDLVILDIMLPELNGVEVIKRLKRDNPKLNILVFSGLTDRSVVNRILKAGVSGYIEKNTGLEELRKAIENVANGQSFFGSKIMAAMQDIMMNGGIDDSVECLTTREREIVQLIAESYSNKEIADKLCISIRTADTHRTNIMRKLKIHDVAGLTRYAIKHNLVSSTETV
ncbi:MAG: response regulator transcription factor [Opitutales bacterium]|nr:response regulator transcription factor [Opitutales bacterium]NRA26965.1 response regulator transcription factor [Opitutales bacterium]